MKVNWLKFDIKSYESISELERDDQEQVELRQNQSSMMKSLQLAQHGDQRDKDRRCLHW